MFSSNDEHASLIYKQSKENISTKNQIHMKYDIAKERRMDRGTVVKKNILSFNNLFKIKFKAMMDIGFRKKYLF